MSTLNGISIKDAITDNINNLPITVCIRDRCMVKNKTVLRKGQYVTILDRKCVLVINGIDSEGKKFIINEARDPEFIVTIVEKEYFPKNKEEIVTLIKKGEINKIILNQKFGLSSSVVLEVGESISINREINELQDGAQSVSLTRDRNAEKLHLLTVDTLHNFNLVGIFSLVRVSTSANIPLRTLVGKNVYFTNYLLSESSILNLPHGIVNVTSLSQIEVVSTVTFPTSSRYLVYEMYPVDERIMVDIFDEKLPKHIKLLGGKHTAEFKQKLQEIQFSTYYVDCYSPRCYGYYIEDNDHCNDDKHLEMIDCKDLVESPLAPSSQARFNKQSEERFSVRLKKPKKFKGIRIFGKKRVKTQANSVDLTTQHENSQDEGDGPKSEEKSMNDTANEEGCTYLEYAGSSKCSEGSQGNAEKPKPDENSMKDKVGGKNFAHVEDDGTSDNDNFRNCEYTNGANIRAYDRCMKERPLPSLPYCLKTRKLEDVNKIPQASFVYEAMVPNNNNASINKTLLDYESMHYRLQSETDGDVLPQKFREFEDIECPSGNDKHIGNLQQLQLSLYNKKSDSEDTNSPFQLQSCSSPCPDRSRLGPTQFQLRSQSPTEDNSNKQEVGKQTPNPPVIAPRPAPRTNTYPNGEVKCSRHVYQNVSESDYHTQQRELYKYFYHEDSDEQGDDTLKSIDITVSDYENEIIDINGNQLSKIDLSSNASPAAGSSNGTKTGKVERCKVDEIDPLLPVKPEHYNREVTGEPRKPRPAPRNRVNTEGNTLHIPRLYSDASDMKYIWGSTVQNACGNIHCI